MRPGMRVARARLRRACWTASSATASTSSAAGRASTAGRPRGPPRRRCSGGGEVTVRATKRGAERTSLDGDARRRPGLRRELRRAGRRARARPGTRRRRAASSTATRSASAPTSACAAPTPWLHAMGVAGRDPPGAAPHDLHHAARPRALPAAVELVGLRLPRRCAELLFAQSRRPLRDRQGRGRRAGADGDVVVAPTAATCARRWSSTRSAGGGCSADPQLPAARRAAVAAGSRSTRTRGGDGDALDVWVERSLVRRGYGWRVPAGGEARIGVGSYEPRDHVKEPTEALAGRLGAEAVALPGQLVPAPPARRGRGRRVLRRRQRRALLPALGRGHPHRLLLRHRLRARAARACWPATHDRDAALARYAAFHDAPRAARSAARCASSACCPALPPRVLTAVLRGLRPQPLVDRAFGWYLDQAHPAFAG